EVPMGDFCKAPLLRPDGVVGRVVRVLARDSRERFDEVGVLREAALADQAVGADEAVECVTDRQRGSRRFDQGQYLGEERERERVVQRTEREADEVLIRQEELLT